MAEEYWHVGYIAKEFAVHLTKLLISDDDEEVDYKASLTFFTNDRGKQSNAVVIEMDIGEER